VTLTSSTSNTSIAAVTRCGQPPTTCPLCGNVHGCYVTVGSMEAADGCCSCRAGPIQHRGLHGWAAPLHELRGQLTVKLLQAPVCLQVNGQHVLILGQVAAGILQSQSAPSRHRCFSW
jgi:hypothetical protein